VARQKFTWITTCFTQPFYSLFAQESLSQNAQDYWRMPKTTNNGVVQSRRRVTGFGSFGVTKGCLSSIKPNSSRSCVSRLAIVGVGMSFGRGASHTKIYRYGMEGQRQ